MSFGTTLREHTTIAAFDDILYIANDYKNITNMKVATSNIKSKMHQLFSAQWIRDQCRAKNLGGLDTNLLLNNV